ncbi:ATP-binding cassette domain-containing protein [Paenibacillus protaetiae]|uniref:ATP-binding cassette domain-containing protein n=2 Tax=Paenibacillus protaetiae TaxID=2509456 RepID=A0A4P6EYM9_9BACL|nr:ATP-binding cassette domain-containing protein [Paenibacillus protaetiae]
MVEMAHIVKRFGQPPAAAAVDGVSLAIRERETYVLVGESGSGKSTLARILVGLERPSEGEVRWFPPQPGSAFAAHGHGKGGVPSSPVQMVFQNPDRSLNPYWRVQNIIAEPLVLQGMARREAYALAGGLLEQVRLPRGLLLRRPSECSGGQKQRIAVARALALRPRLLVADEMTSALDPATEADMMQLLMDLQWDSGMSILFITHRLDAVHGFADRMGVMRQGRIVEEGEAASLLRQPSTAYAKALLAACQYT